MDVHKNARLTFHSRDTMVRRVTGRGPGPDRHKPGTRHRSSPRRASSAPSFPKASTPPRRLGFSNGHEEPEPGTAPLVAPVRGAGPFRSKSLSHR